jgi:hypothetical protein
MAASDYLSRPQFHGTPAALSPGDLIEPNKYPPTTPDPDIRGSKASEPRKHVHFTSRQDYVTEHYGPNVYHVETTGPVSHDPEYSNKRMLRSAHPLRVVRQVSHSWGTPAE